MFLTLKAEGCWRTFTRYPQRISTGFIVEAFVNVVMAGTGRRSAFLQIRDRLAAVEVDFVLGLHGRVGFEAKGLQFRGNERFQGSGRRWSGGRKEWFGRG